MQRLFNSITLIHIRTKTLQFTYWRRLENPLSRKLFGWPQAKTNPLSRQFVWPQAKTRDRT